MVRCVYNSMDNAEVTLVSLASYVDGATREARQEATPPSPRFLSPLYIDYHTSN